MSYRYPPGISPELHEALRQIWLKLDPLTQGNIDLHGQRIINAGEAVAGGDYTTAAEVEGTYVTQTEFDDHSARHEDGGADEVSVAGLSGLLADAQTPLAHNTSHENGGSDEISVAGLSGLLADGQTPLAHAASHADGGSDPVDVTGLDGFPGGGTTFLRDDGTFATPSGAGDVAGPASAVDERIAVFDGITGKLIKDGGDRIIDVLAMALATAENYADSAIQEHMEADDPHKSLIPAAHATSHQNGGADEISVAGLSGLLEDAQTPLEHGNEAHNPDFAPDADLTTLEGDVAAHVADTANPHAVTAAQVGALETVAVDPAGALDGDGTGASPLAVLVDGVTVTINGSNQLEAVGGSGLTALQVFARVSLRG